jgi:hypothetical protein
MHMPQNSFVSAMPSPSPRSANESLVLRGVQSTGRGLVVDGVAFIHIDGICGLLTQGWHLISGSLVTFFRRTGSFKLFQVCLGKRSQVGVSLDEFSKLLVENHTFALLSSRPDNIT